MFPEFNNLWMPISMKTCVNAGNIPCGVALCFVFFIVSSCTPYTPAIMINFVDHNSIFFLVGSNRMDDLSFHGVEEEPELNTTFGTFDVYGEGELRFLELVIQFNPESITVNGAPVDLDSKISANRIVYEDGRVIEGNLYGPHEMNLPH